VDLEVIKDSTLRLGVVEKLITILSRYKNMEAVSFRFDYLKHL